ncbi:MAG: response regulator [Campylobacterota bacterium]|nr:response regulator [Campylobacterota bacterium]
MITVSKLKEYAADIKVLYVEDDKSIQDEIHDFLSRFFPVIDLADNGQDGLERYKHKNYDIVISDINMPKMNGIEMIHAIKEINEDQKIIITSAYNEPQYLMKLIDDGVDKFVLKPFNNKKFLLVLYKICEFINTQKNEELLQKQILKKNEETQIIVDFIEHGIIIIEDGAVTRVNKQFLEMAGYENLESCHMKVKDISFLFEKRKGYIDIDSNKEFIQLLELDENRLHKAIMKVGLEDKVYLLKCKKVDDENKYIISFTDITDEERLININTKTGLPNIYAITANIEHRINNKIPFTIDLIRIENIEKMVKWHGKEIRNSVDENVAMVLNNDKKTLDENGVFIAYYGHNKFVLIRDEKKQELVNKIINKISLLTAIENKKNHKLEKTNIFYKPIHLSIKIDENKIIDDILKIIDEKFQEILL